MAFHTGDIPPAALTWDESAQLAVVDLHQLAAPAGTTALHKYHAIITVERTITALRVCLLLPAVTCSAVMTA